MTDNYARISGTVLRDVDITRQRGKTRTLFFTVAVPTEGDSYAYVDCLAFPDLYEEFDGFLEAGERITVEGMFDFRTWTDGRGVKRSGTEIRATNIELEA